MAIGFPTKANWAAGDVLTASTLDDLAGTVNLLNPTAKGGIVAGTGANTTGVLTVGADGTTLVANSASATGVAWTAGNPIPNPVLNSSYQVWQRGTSIAVTANTATYTADRWMLNPSGLNLACTVSRQATNDTTNLPNIQYCARVQRNSGQTGTAPMYFAESFETINSVPFSGKTVTMSFYARAGANFSSTSNNLSFYVDSGTGTDQNSIVTGYTGGATPVSNSATLTTTWQRFTATGTIATSATEIAVRFTHSPTGTAGANDYYEVTGVQLDIGSVALPFRTYAGTLQGELMACQRYYEKSYSQTDFAGNATSSGSAYLTQGSDGGNNSAYALRFKVEKRNASWSAAYYTTAGTVGNWQYVRSGVGATNAAIATDLQATSGARIYLNSGAAWTVNTIQGHWVVDNEL